MDGLETKIKGKTLPELKQIALKEIRSMNLNLLQHYANQYSIFYSRLIEGEIIGEFEVNEQFEEAILEKAKESLKYLQENRQRLFRCYPEDLQNPEILAYAISTGNIKPEELKGVRLKSCSLEDFVQKYVKIDLVERYTKEFLNPSSVTKRSKYLA